MIIRNKKTGLFLEEKGIDKAEIKNCEEYIDDIFPRKDKWDKFPENAEKFSREEAHELENSNPDWEAVENNYKPVCTGWGYLN